MGIAVAERKASLQQKKIINQDVSACSLFDTHSLHEREIYPGVPNR